MTRCLARPAGRNVRITTLTFAGGYNGQDEKFLGAYHARIPVGRMAPEDDYNGAIIFLLS